MKDETARHAGSSAALAREAARKGIHLTSTVVPLALATGGTRRVVGTGLVVLFAIALAVELARRMSPSITAWFARRFAPLLRPRESTHVTGATWLLGAMLVAVALLPLDAAIAATWAVAAGDAGAAMIGIRFGRHRSASGKSLEGSAACMLVTTIGALLLARMPFAESATLGVVAAIAERAPWPADDNARIVALVGAVAWLWSMTSY